MKILIVDDSLEKTREITRCLVSNEDIDLASVDNATNTFDAKKMLIKNTYDLLILDISLPENKLSEEKSDEGIQFLKHISLSKDVNSPKHIIGVTAYKEVLELSKKAFDEKAWTVIHFDISKEGWKKSITEKINYINKTTELKADSVRKFDVAIVTAVEIEHKSIMNLPLEWSKFSVENDPTVYYQSILKCPDSQKKLSLVTATTDRMGMVSSAILTSKLIFNFRPDFIGMAGICAGIEGKVSIGDVVVGDSIWAYESGKHILENGNPKFMPSPHQINISQTLRASLKDSISNSKFIDEIYCSWPHKKPATEGLKAVLAPMCSGSAVIANDGLLSKIVDQHRNVTGLEMEGYGVMGAVESSGSNKPECVVIKSVCDFADSKKGDNWQEYAAFTSSQYLYRFLVDYCFS